MRIIAGQYKGKKLISPQSNDIRPTSDRTREALFSKISHILLAQGLPIAEQTVLDVFAGTGAVGLEALSRGVASVCFIDIGRESLKCLRQNIELLKLAPARARIAPINAVKPGTCRLDTPATIVYADPPYRKEMAAPALDGLAKNGWIAENALCMAETDVKEDAQLSELFEVFETRKYGKNKITFAYYKPQKQPE